MMKIFSIVNGKDFLEDLKNNKEVHDQIEKSIDRVLDDLFGDEENSEAPSSKPNKITEKDVHDILSRTLIKTKKYGDKTTILMATLPNGFEIVTSSSCVDPKNFNMKTGEEICMNNLENKIWELEGYRLQCEISKKGGNK